jgi:hypothetical protein
LVKALPLLQTRSGLSRRTAGQEYLGTEAFKEEMLQSPPSVM